MLCSPINTRHCCFCVFHSLWLGCCDSHSVHFCEQKTEGIRIPEGKGGGDTQHVEQKGMMTW